MLSFGRGYGLVAKFSIDDIIIRLPTFSKENDDEGRSGRTRVQSLKDNRSSAQLLRFLWTNGSAWKAIVDLAS